jgi:hypothetical protein
MKPTPSAYLPLTTVTPIWNGVEEPTHGTAEIVWHTGRKAGWHKSGLLVDYLGGAALGGVANQGEGAALARSACARVALTQRGTSCSETPNSGEGLLEDPVAGFVSNCAMPTEPKYLQSGGGGTHSDLGAEALSLPPPGSIGAIPSLQYTIMSRCMC